MGRWAWLVVVPGLLALLSCGEDSTSGGASGPTTSTSSRAPAVMLADRLAEKGDIGLFDHRYVTALGEDGLLFVGVDEDTAVAYACVPKSGSTWLAGTVSGGEVDLSAPAGPTLNGTIDADTLVATLTGAPSNNGEVTLAEDPTARVQRQAGVPKSEVVSGLVEHDGRVRGTLGATSVVSKPLAGATVGVSVSQVRGQISITFAVPAALVSTSERALSTQATKMREIRAAAETIEQQNIAIQQGIEEAAAKAEQAMDAAFQEAQASVVAGIVAVAASGASLGTSGSAAKGVAIRPWAGVSLRDAVLRLVTSQTTTSTTTTTSPSTPIPVPTMTVVALAS